MKLGHKNLRNLRKDALTLIAAVSALAKWRRRSRARRALDGSVHSVKRHPVRTVLGALALGIGARAIMGARQG
jgi:hypothetical protein